MGIFGKLKEFWAHHRQRQAERKALRVLIDRRDRRLLRDAGLDLVEGSRPRCESLPQTKERRWSAPLIRLPPPSLRKRSDGGGTTMPSSDRPAA